MNKKSILVIFMCIVTVGLFAQSGTLDNTFDKDGILTTRFDEDAIATDMTIQSDGKIVVTGYTKTKFILIRYKTNGEIDQSFGDSGKVERLLSEWIRPAALGIQTNGQIIVGGSFKNSYALARYNSKGVLDTSFGSDGLMLYKVNWYDGNELFHLLIEPDGNILVSGISVIVASDGVFFGVLLRFNKNGKQVLSYTDFNIEYQYPTPSLNLQKDGKIVVAYPMGDYKIFWLARYNSNFALDSTFNKTGKQIIEERIYNSTSICQDDGKLIISGITMTGIESVLTLFRYNVDGSLDSSFGNAGKAKTNSNTKPALLKVQLDGKIVVAGEANNKGVLIRYNTNGSLDSTFGVDGVTYTTIGDTYHINSLSLQQDGKIIVAGYSFNGNDSDFALSRYNPGLILGTFIPTISKKSIRIYPNPLSEIATLEYNLEKEEILSIFLVDVQGKLIKTFIESSKQPQGLYQQILTFPEGLVKGSYYIIVTTPKGRMVSKILKV